MEFRFTQELKKLCVCATIFLIICGVIACAIRVFSISMIPGGIVGVLLFAFTQWHLFHSICALVYARNPKGKMFSSYCFRLFVIGVVFYLSSLTSWIHPIFTILPQFTPKIYYSGGAIVKNLIEKIKKKKEEQV